MCSGFELPDDFYARAQRKAAARLFVRKHAPAEPVVRPTPVYYSFEVNEPVVEAPAREALVRQAPERELVSVA